MSEAGILPDHEIAALFDAGALASTRALDPDQIQPASLDLRLGAKAWRVRASFLPGPASTVADKLERLRLHEIDLTEGAVLETGCVYIVPLLESLALPADVSASANPKSSTGRLDIFTRVMADNGQEFDKMPAGYAGPGRKLARTRQAFAPSRRSRLAGWIWSGSSGRVATSAPAWNSAAISWSGRMPACFMSPRRFNSSPIDASGC